MIFYLEICGWCHGYSRSVEDHGREGHVEVGAVVEQVHTLRVRGCLISED